MKIRRAIVSILTLTLMPIAAVLATPAPASAVGATWSDSACAEAFLGDMKACFQALRKPQRDGTGVVLEGKGVWGNKPPGFVKWTDIRVQLKTMENRVKRTWTYSDQTHYQWYATSKSEYGTDRGCMKVVLRQKAIIRRGRDVIYRAAVKICRRSDRVLWATIVRA